MREVSPFELNFALDSPVIVGGAVVLGVLLVSTLLAVGFDAFLTREGRRTSAQWLGRFLVASLWALPVFCVVAFVLYMSLSRPQVQDIHLVDEEYQVARRVESGEVHDDHDHALPDDPDHAHAGGRNSEGETDSASEVAFVPEGPSEELPAWVERGRSEVQSGEITTTTWDVVTGGYYADAGEAEAEAYAKATQLVHAWFSQRNSFPGQWALPQDIVRVHAVHSTYMERDERDLGPTSATMYRQHLQVGFTPELEQAIRPVWREQVVERRLWGLGGIVGLLTLIAGSLATYFRIDAATDGQYRRRLKFAAVSLIIAGGLFAATLV